MLILGERGGFDLNPNGVVWDSTKRVLSFWYKGGFGGTIDVWITSSAGNNQIRYYGYSGSNYDNGQGNVAFHLGSGVNTTMWKRFERNIEADYNSVAVGKTWVNTDGVSIKPSSTLDYDFYVDDMTLCDAMTVEYNKGPRHRTISASTSAHR